VLYNEQRHVGAFIYVLFHDIEIITNDEALFSTIFPQIKVYVKKKKRDNERIILDGGRESLIPSYTYIIYQNMHNWQYITYLDMRNPVNIS
jgi:hypothetical protein